MHIIFCSADPRRAGAEMRFIASARLYTSHACRQPLGSCKTLSENELYTICDLELIKHR